MYTEVIQNSVIGLIREGRVKFGSACSLTVTNDCLEGIYQDMDFFRDKLVLRPSEISNSPEVVRRLGIISINTAIEADIYGNVNSTCIYGKGDYVKPQTRFTGSGGANGIATYCNTIIMMQHQKRRFMEKIDYITSCGWMDGPGGREKVGLPGNRGPQMVVTDLGIMKFDEETKRMYLAYYYPFSSPEMVQENTGFEVDVSRAQLFEGPSPEIIRVIREEIDPGQAFIKVPKE